MYLLHGKVIHGQKRGRALGFPTANIKLSKDIPEGIYVSTVYIKKVPYPSLTFIGNATTFNEKLRQAEVYVLNFKRNIYGKWIKVRLIDKVRDNKKFTSLDALKKQMVQDKEIAIKYFARRSSL